MIPMREECQTLIERLVGHYDGLCRRAKMTRGTQAALLDVSRQTWAYYQRKPTAVDGATFLRMRAIAKDLEGRLAAGELPLPNRSKRHAQPAIREIYGLPPEETETTETAGT